MNRPQSRFISRLIQDFVGMHAVRQSKTDTMESYLFVQRVLRSR